jgi:hypothetical protein
MLITKYYRARDGSQPVKDSIDRLDVKTRAKIFQHIERLNALGESLDSTADRGRLRSSFTSSKNAPHDCLPQIPRLRRPDLTTSAPGWIATRGNHRARLETMRRDTTSQRW